MSATTLTGPVLQIDGAAYEAVIGIECHVELKTESKMFCGCRNIFGGEPNTNVCEICLGMPGSLPVPNRRAIAHVVKAGLAFGATIPAYSKFDRKNYFYPDMPKNYQISQYDVPLTSGGTVEFWLPDGTRRTCGLTRIHLEEDTGKSLHAGSADGRLSGSTYSLVDFNRAGVPLMECVSEPDLRSAVEAVAYLEALKRTFVALGVSDVKMEEGSLRCDANVSIRPVGATALGTKTEIKNMNSFRSVLRAVDSEIARQREILASGGRIVQETRGWDEAGGVTHPQRSKEQAHDYRYFPDPDLVPIEFAPDEVARLRAELGELPQARLERFILGDRLSLAAAHQMADTSGLADFYDASVRAGGAPGATANFVLGELSRLANESGTPLAASAVTPQALAELVALTAASAINSKVAKDVLARVWVEGGSPKEIVEREGLAQVNDAGAIDALVAAVARGNEKSVGEYRAGKTKVVGFLLGRVMQQSGGKVNPELAKERLLAFLETGL
ncbi:MAG TPA: Asp-tRNA(Asn)/Glu-tRNA(Gln) amidotransferase subunit GatB [Candidatus Baltobacteraceae bacterium]|nr:Asp-tRNA(Asn)/Glu-tRNA(Gln) amidotransferase subunit GatB [Candidatus Baltobacteraceae bacterium]